MLWAGYLSQVAVSAFSNAVGLSAVLGYAALFHAVLHHAVLRIPALTSIIGEFDGPLIYLGSSEFCPSCHAMPRHALPRYRPAPYHWSPFLPSPMLLITLSVIGLRIPHFIYNQCLFK